MNTFRLSYSKAKLNSIRCLGRTGFSLLLLFFSFTLLTAQCPELISFDSSNSELCDGDDITLYFEGTPDALVTISVTGFADMTTALDADGLSEITITAPIGSYDASLVSISDDDCSVDLSDVQPLEFTVNAIPEVTSFIIDPSEVCAGETVYVIIEGTPNATVDAYLDGYGDFEIDINAIGVGSESFELEAGEYSVSLLEVYDENCDAELDEELAFTINETPNLYYWYQNSSEVCEEQSNSIYIFGTEGSTVTFEVDGVEYSETFDESEFLFFDLVLEPGTYTASITSHMLGDCSSNFDVVGDISWEVLPLPELTSLSVEADVCESEETVFLLTGDPFAFVEFIIDGNYLYAYLDEDGEASITTLFDAGEYETDIIYIWDEEFNCYNNEEIEVSFEVYANPELDDFYISPTEVCEGEGTGINYVGTPGAVVSISIPGIGDYTSTIGEDGTIGFGFFADPGTYTATLGTISDENCTVDLSGWSSIDFTVLEGPELVNFEIEEPTVCSGTFGTIIIEGTPNSSVVILIDGEPLTSISLDADGYSLNTFDISPGTYNFSLLSITDEDGCMTDLIDIPAIAFTMLANPTVDEWELSSDEVCDGEANTLTIYGTPNSLVTIDSPDGEIEISLDGDGLGSAGLSYGPGEHTVELLSIQEGNCFTDYEGITLDFEVLALPEVIDFYVQATPVCEGEAIWITVQGEPGATVVVDIPGYGTMDSELDESGFDTFGTFLDAGVYTASLVSITNEDCSADLSDWPAASFEVLPLPELTSISLDPSESCDGEPTFIFLEGTPDATIDIDINGDLYSVTLDDAGLEALSLVLEPGDYTVQPLEANDACYSDLSDMSSLEFTVKPNPELLTFDVTPEACEGEFIWLSFAGTPGASINVSVPGVGTYDTDVLNDAGTYTFGFIPTAGTYTATLNSITLNGCTTDLSDWTPIDFTVNPLAELISAEFTMDEYCEGEVPTLNIEGTPGSTINLDWTPFGNFNFTIGDDGNLQITAASTVGEYDISLNTLTTPEGCVTTLDEDRDYIVKPNPVLTDAYFAPSVCDDEVTGFYYEGTPGASLTIDIPGAGTYTPVLDEDGFFGGTIGLSPGTYTATFISIELDGCVTDLSDWAPIDFEVLPLPEITSYTIVPDNVCVGDVWTFTVEGTPGASFEVSYTNNGFPINTESLTIGADGTWSNDISWFSEGEWVFTLGSVTLDGCVADYSHLSNTINIHAYPELVDFYMGPSTTCEGDATYLLLEGTPNATVVLNVSGIGDMTVILDEDGEHAEALMPDAGTYTASLISITMNGCSVDLSNEASIDFTVNPSPVFTSMTVDPTSVCEGESVTLSLEGTPGAEVAMYIGNDGTYDATLDEDGLHSASFAFSAGEYNFELLSITLGDCEVDLSDESIIDWEVLPNPELNSFDVTPEVCEGETTWVSFNGTTNAVVNVDIPGVGNYDSFPLDGDGNYSFGFNAPAGSYTATLTIVSLDGCVTDLSEWESIDFTVLPNPELTDFSITESVCSGELVSVTYLGTPDAWVNVDIPGIGNYDSQLDADGNYTFSFFAGDGTYTATVNTIELDGCTTALSESLTFEVAECPLIYCDSYGLSTANEYINQVKHNGGSFDNVSGDDGGYGDYTSLTLNIEQGDKEALRLQPGYTGGSDWVYWRVWVDWNQNGIFENSEREIQKRAQSTITRHITAPHDAELGLTMMRVSMKAGGYPTQCEVFDEGEVEDYTVMVTAGSAPVIEEDDNIAEVNTEVEVIETEQEVDADDTNTNVEFDEIEISIETEERIDLSTVSMKVYPNPTADVLYIKFEELDDYSKVDLKIYNERGQLIMSQVPNDLNNSEIQISVEHLNPGIYMVVLGSEGQKISTERFIKIY